MLYIAHRREDGTEQTVLAHLEGTATLSESFAASFDSAQMGRVVGMLHDIGKYSHFFQRRIRDPQHIPPHDHATAGAKELGFSPMAFAIAGHHGGIPDGGNRHDPSSVSTLFGRLKKPVDDYSAWKKELPLPPLIIPDFLKKADAFTHSFYTRMLYSCLVDADFLDTEAFMNGSQPRGNYEDIPTLLHKLDTYLSRWDAPVTPLNTIRSEILANCISGADYKPGLFTLTVPTGGGKTISSLRYALGHAAEHEQSRIIYVIPYTSIIDQTAQVFKDILGEDQVVEHHSGVAFDEDSWDHIPDRKRLATENWDAPIIVTTGVQFFESLFSNRPSQCRKLHNIANSVVIFDEAQTLPIPYLRPCVAAIAQLVKHYHTTAVLCTATQPELGGLFQKENLQAQEIIPHPHALYAQLKRVTFRDFGTPTWTELGDTLAQTPQVLCIVNRRKSAQQLYESLPEEGTYCLSTLICPHDRKRMFKEIRTRLKDGLPCRVISTSLIEAGVDLDFPSVYREKAGLDSILQAAGRCNREGTRSANESPVWFFTSEEGATPIIRQNTDVFNEILRTHPDPSTPEAISAYFQTLWYLKNEETLDQKQILRSFEKGIGGSCLPFRQVSENFRFIESPTRTVYIPQPENRALLQSLRYGASSRTLYRQLSPFAVSIYPDHLKQLCDAGVIECLDSGDMILLDHSLYHPKIGLSLIVETGIGYFI